MHSQVVSHRATDTAMPDTAESLRQNIGVLTVDIRKFQISNLGSLLEALDQVQQLSDLKILSGKISDLHLRTLGLHSIAAKYVG